MCGAGTKIYSLFNFFFLLVWLQEEDGGWAGSAVQGNACGFYRGRVAVAYLEASDLQGRYRNVFACLNPPAAPEGVKWEVRRG